MESLVVYLTTGDQLNKCKHRNSSRNKQMDDVWFCFSAQIWINTVLFLWMTFSLWVPSVCHNNRNYRLRLCGTTHTVAFRKKIAHKMTLYNIPLKNKIQEIWGRILICHFFIVVSLNYPKDETVFWVSMYEKAKKKPWGIRKGTEDIYAHSRVVGRAMHRTSKQSELDFCKLYLKESAVVLTGCSYNVWQTTCCYL